MNRNTKRIFSVVIASSISMVVLYAAWNLFAKPPFHLEVPISVNSRSIIDVFHINSDYSGDYNIYIKLNKKLGFQKTKCILGLSDRSDISTAQKCTSEPINVSWIQYSKRTMMASGSIYPREDRYGAYTNDSVGLYLGNIILTKGIEYKLQISIDKNANEFDILDPSIAIELHPSDLMDIGVRKLYITIFGISYVFISILSLAWLRKQDTY